MLLNFKTGEVVYSYKYKKIMPLQCFQT